MIAANLRLNEEDEATVRPRDARNREIVPEKLAIYRLFENLNHGDWRLGYD